MAVEVAVAVRVAVWVEELVRVVVALRGPRLGRETPTRRQASVPPSCGHRRPTLMGGIRRYYKRERGGRI